MIAALMLDLDDAPDFPGNSGVALGRALSAYPWIASRGSSHIARRYVVTSSPPVKASALQYGAVILDPPANQPPAAAGSLAALRAQMLHGFKQLEAELSSDGGPLELLVVLLSNAPTVTTELLDKGIEALQSRPELDSAISASAQNRYNPYFAQKENAGGLLEPMTPLSREPHCEIYYPDWGAQILRPKHLAAEADDRAFPWLGKRVLPLKQWGGGAVDYSWQIPSLEYWLKKNGFSDMSGSLEMQPKPQPLPQSKPKPRG